MGRSNLDFRRMCVYCSVGGLTFQFSIESGQVPNNYQPFIVEKADNLLFRLSVVSHLQSDSVSSDAQLVHIDRQEADMPRLEVYREANKWILLTSMYRDAAICSRLEANDDWSEATLYVGEEARDFAINNAMMMLYAFTSLKYRALEMHASVTVRGDKGYLFLGKSGTGKSTHSRLWQAAFSDAWLLNDDNPIVRIEDDGIWVYGSPWSGKTPCYKSERRKVGAFVQLFQAPANSISPCRPSKAYIYIFSSSSGLKFLETVCDQLYDIVAEIIKKVGVYELQCLPNEEAAQLCAQTCLS